MIKILRVGKKTRVVLAAVVAMVVLAGCSSAAPIYMYGTEGTDEIGQHTIQPDWADQPAVWKDFWIPTRAPLGVVRINAFIPEWQITGSLGLTGYGNGRDFDSNSDAFASKFSIELDFMAGRGRVLYTESCAELPLPWPFPAGSTQKTCLEPHAIVDAIGQPGTNGFRVVANEPGGSGVDIYLLTSAENAFSQHPLAGDLRCSIDVGFHVWTDQGAVRAETWAPFQPWKVDPYPSLEAYWYDGLNRPAVTLFKRPRSDRGPSSLCDVEGQS